MSQAKPRFQVGYGIAFLISFVIGFAVPFALGLTLFGFSCGIFCSLFGSLVVIFALAAGLITGVIGLVIFTVWRVLGPRGQLGIIAILFVLGILLVQPELDIFAVIGLVFTGIGVRSAASKPMLAG